MDHVRTRLFDRLGSICVLLLGIVLAACGSPRPVGPPEAIDCGLADFVVQDVYSDWLIYRRSLLQTEALDSPKPSFNMLTLSAGGEYGAYGAGFLRGWSDAGPKAQPSARSDIQVVTGVSTGAIIATHAFLGRDEVIDQLYRSLSGPMIYQQRSLLGLLRANSLFDAAGKDALIETHLSTTLIDAVATAPAGRFLYLGVVDLDSGRFMRIDMGKLARQLEPRTRRDACYRSVVGASSAIPIAFSPKFIDQLMLTDGGARRHLFITDPPAEAKKPGVERRLFSIVHGTLDVGCEQTKNGVLQIAGRSAALFADQSFKDSLRLADDLAKAPVAKGDATPLFKTFYATAAAAARSCAGEILKCQGQGGLQGEDMFCQPFMVCLADQGLNDGRAYGASDRSWLQFADLNLSSTPNCSATPARSPFIR